MGSRLAAVTVSVKQARRRVPNRRVPALMLEPVQSLCIDRLIVVLSSLLAII
jgi:hypothetical protein